MLRCNRVECGQSLGVGCARQRGHLRAPPHTRPLGTVQSTGSGLTGRAAAGVDPALGADDISTRRCPAPRRPASPARPRRPLCQLLLPSAPAATSPCCCFCSCSSSPVGGRTPLRSWNTTGGGARLVSGEAAELAAMTAELSRSAIINLSARSEPAQICRGGWVPKPAALWAHGERTPRGGAGWQAWHAGLHAGLREGRVQRRARLAGHA